MEILENLKDQGWYLTIEGLKKLPDNSDPKKIISAALDFDFREIAGGALPPDISKKDESFPGNIVLQVQKIRNISAPKANEESKAAPRFLQIEFSDGVTLMQALEIEHISVLSLNTPPGTKIHFKCKQIPLLQGMIVMKPTDIQLLGGKVSTLIEKWETARAMQKFAKFGRQQTGGSGGPPPWIKFGQKLQPTTVSADKNFKSLVQAEKEKENCKENEEFKAMRSEAIAEAAKVGGKKVFGGGNHNILDHNVKKILEKGYTEEEAKHALRTTGNSLERAMYNLKRRGDNVKGREDFRDKSSTLPMGGKRGMKELGGKRGSKEAEIVGAAKPAANVSLFDFLTDKLPSNTDQTASALSQSTTTSATTAPPSTSFASHSSSSRYDSYSRPPMTKAGSEPSTKPYFHSSSSSNPFHSYPDRKQQQQQQQSHESSSSVKSQEQNQTNSNRPKFENNLSSSFATRNSSHPNDDRYNRYPNSNRGRGGSGAGESFNPFRGRPNQHYEENSERHRDQRNSSAYSSGRGGGRGSHNNNYSGGRGGSSSGGYDNRRYNDFQNQKDQQNQQRQERQDQHPPQRNGYEQKASSNGKEASTSSTSRYHQQKENTTNYQNNSGNTRNHDNTRQLNYNASVNNNNTSQNSSHNTSSSSNNTNNNDHSARINKLVESTSKLKLDKTRSGPSPRNQQQQHPQYQQQQHQNHASQQQQQQQHQQQQSKQQQPPMNSSTTQKLQQTFGPLPNGFNYDPSKIIGFQSKETNEFALTLLKSQGVPTGPPSHAGPNQASSPTAQPQFLSGPPPSAMHIAPQPFTPTTFVMPQAVAPPTHTPSAFGMIPGDNWNWKIGDRCLAKYWDDGRYYEAEITGISDKTCVVLFLGYGNHEEVLKSDCLPITDSQNRTINFSNNMQHAPTVSVAAPPQQQSSMLSRGVPNRYRGERQVYVPPPKREN